MTAAQLELLDLPPELILACLLHLSFHDLNSCLRCGNRLLHDIIANSVLLRYRREQELAGVEENPFFRSTSGISDRLADLRNREENWLGFSPRSTRAIPLDFESGGIYDLASDIYLVGNTADPTTGLCTAIKYVYTSPGSDLPEWREISAGRSIIDFGTALEEHDLIAIVTYTPHDSNPQMASIDALLFHLSTGAPHSLANNPTIHIHDVERHRGRPGISIEISGDVLALSLLYWEYEERDLDVLQLFDWKSGASRMTPLSIYNTGLVFITEHIIAVPNCLEAKLDILIIPPAKDDNTVPRFVYSLLLPSMKPDMWVHSFQCRGAPNPRAGLNRFTRARFLPRPQDAILLFILHIGNDDVATNHMFVLHRLSFLRLLDVCAKHANSSGLILEWPSWGPVCTRWLNANSLSMQYITTTVGQRMVTIANSAPDQPAPIHVLSFNAEDVEAQRLRKDESIGPHATVRVVEEGGLQLEPFEDTILSLIPFVETRSRELFDYNAVLINDENIVGARFGARHVESLHVHHFG
ncbi:hypothetical protein C8F04DRAFT_1070007 [Mycena alexandri]|uniref:F-box domain-containing protein n=1 Tax=Mycena alexandri TaxID=1745969 RepID=A0AAD6THA9_9AGAR|nr:hypothetical protein C8F04DRAFT_1070007 [Mycena alexandri]